MIPTATSRRADLTFQHNLKKGRHGWLRLTPAYSVKVVSEILDEHLSATSVLDPFSGTGTTGLVCAERGIECDLLELNPFLVWLARAKISNYSESSLATVRHALGVIKRRTLTLEGGESWLPPLSNIERWWNPNRLSILSRLFHAIQEELSPGPSRDLALLGFCRTMIEWSNAAFNHQSMSFKDETQSLFAEDEDDQVLTDFIGRMSGILAAAETPVSPSVVVRMADSRQIPSPTRKAYDLVITSPPYPNRMSYIRELRPYMYWLGFLKEAREAGDLDWDAIGGTWGVATSRVEKWRSDGTEVPFFGFASIIRDIATRSTILANYVHKYFIDMTLHLSTLHPQMASGGQAYYVVGNSKFYDTMVPVEKIFGAIMLSSGFRKVDIRELRKRNSKKELIEFVVCAEA
jgi:hypothetical protein